MCPLKHIDRQRIKIKNNYMLLTGESLKVKEWKIYHLNTNPKKAVDFKANSVIGVKKR